MSQKHLAKNSTTTKTYTTAYQPLPVTTTAVEPNLQQQYQQLQQSVMDNPALTSSVITTNDEGGSIVSIGGSTLPSTTSSQRLMPASSESDSFGENGDSGAGLPGNHHTQTSAGAQRRSRATLCFTVGTLCFVNLINYMDRFTIAGVLTDIQEDFKIGDDEGGLLQTAFVLSYMICAPIFGYLGDRYSRRWIMAIGVLLWSTTTLLGSFMNTFGGFITFRELVGIGEALYSTIAPTIISDLFVHDMRSKMLAMFYFAIPVGSGFGYIVGSETARLANNWRWALRVTPILGIAAVVLILLIKDPERGESEGSQHMEPTTFSEDIKDLVKNRSFMLSTAGFTCVAFVTGALAWWGPKFMYLGIRMQPGSENITLNDVAFKFGAITMVAGLIGVPMGSYLSQYLLKRLPTADPLICAFGLLTSVPLMTGAMILVSKNANASYALMFFGELALNLNWAIVADILLYVVVPTRRSTAEAFQILISHALGDAGSPYLVGVLSEAIKKHLRLTTHKATELVSTGFESLSLTLGEMQLNETTTLELTTTLEPTTNLIATSLLDQDTNLTKFEALQYALFSTSFVEVVGGIFFLLTAAFIIKDKQKAVEATREGGHHAVPNHPPIADID